jgi:hypothetical protein
MSFSAHTKAVMIITKLKFYRAHYMTDEIIIPFYNEIPTFHQIIDIILENRQNINFEFLQSVIEYYLTAKYGN